MDSSRILSMAVLLSIINFLVASEPKEDKNDIKMSIGFSVGGKHHVTPQSTSLSELTKDIVDTVNNNEVFLGEPTIKSIDKDNDRLIIERSVVVMLNVPKNLIAEKSAKRIPME